MFVIDEVSVGPMEGNVDDVGLEEDDGIVDTLGDEVGVLSHTGTSQGSKSQYPPYSSSTANPV